MGALLNGLSNGLGMYVAGRVVIGAGGGMTKVVAVALLHEVAHPRFRPTDRIGSILLTLLQWVYSGRMADVRISAPGEHQLVMANPMLFPNHGPCSGLQPHLHHAREPKMDGQE